MQWNPEKQTKLIIDSLIEKATKGDKNGLLFVQAVQNQNKKVMYEILMEETENMKKRVLKHIKNL